MEKQVTTSVIPARKSPYLQESASTRESDLILLKMAAYCINCHLAVRVQYLVDGRCPECRPNKTA